MKMAALLLLGMALAAITAAGFGLNQATNPSAAYTSAAVGVSGIGVLVVAAAVFAFS